jgi:hypothetical protein
MKRLLLLLMLVSQPVWAEWVEAGRSGEGTGAHNYYWDPTTVRKTANGRRAWLMSSWDQPQTRSFGNYQSTKELWEFDCAGERVRTLQASAYSGPNGAGEELAKRDNPVAWSFAIPGSNGEYLLNAACKVILK